MYASWYHRADPPPAAQAATSHAQEDGGSRHTSRSKGKRMKNVAKRAGRGRRRAPRVPSCVKVSRPALNMRATTACSCSTPPPQPPYVSTDATNTRGRVVHGRRGVVDIARRRELGGARTSAFCSVSVCVDVSRKLLLLKTSNSCANHRVSPSDVSSTDRSIRPHTCAAAASFSRCSAGVRCQHTSPAAGCCTARARLLLISHS